MICAGKRIGIGMKGAGYTFTRDVVLTYYGWTISPAARVPELGPAEQNQALCRTRSTPSSSRPGIPMD